MNDVPDELQTGWNELAKGATERALVLAEALVAARPEDGRPLFLLACCYERLGRYRRADRCFRTAARAPLEPEPSPWRTTWRHFAQAVERAAEALPADLQHRLEEVAIVLADHAPPAIALAADNPEPLSWFSPAAASHTGEEMIEAKATIGPRIHLFRRPHEHHVSSGMEFDLEVQRSLYQELGHYLGLSAEDMAQRGLLD